MYINVDVQGIRVGMSAQKFNRNGECFIAIMKQVLGFFFFFFSEGKMIRQDSYSVFTMGNTESRIL